MNCIKRINNTFFLFAFFAISITASAQDSTIFSPSQIGSATSFQHITTNLEGPANTKDVNPFTYISLRIKEGMAPYTNYSFKIAFELTPVLPDGSLDNTNITDVDLEVKNKQISGSGNHIGIKQFILEGKYGAIANNIVTTFIDENGVTSTTSVPSNIELEIGFNAKRYYDLPSTVPTITENTTSNKLQINWNTILEASYYDVEWTWIDNYGTDENTPLSQNQIYFSEKDFQRNSTRVQTQQTSYSVPLIYAKGFLIYRVRTVGHFVSSSTTIEDLTKHKYGPWTSGTNNKELVSDWPNVFEISQDHEANKNWQFQSSYAEEGKKKEVISYFDGTLRNRQTITSINTDDNAVIGEVIYDAQGRPAIEVLPTPIPENVLKYHEEYRNRNTSSIPYHFTDFDKDLQNQVDMLSADKLMSTSSGASQYYSPANTINSNFKNRIPDANGYPFSQIEYTPDNTGRIRRKSGVGATHQFGSKHEMEYYYGVPEQKELNRLFGYSVGDASKYKKNMVLDPNRQLSVSYIDPQGRTIATALAGEHPKDSNQNKVLEPLEDETNNSLHGQVASDLLGKVSSTDNDTDLDNNQLGITGHFGPLYDRLSYGAYKTVVFNETRNFDYKVTNTQPFFHYDCVEDNSYPVVYDLDISIINEDAEAIISEPVSETINLGNEASNLFTLDPLRTAAVERGTFMITKNLTVNKYKVEEYASNYIARITDVNDPCYVSPEVIAGDPIFIDGCFSTCEECERSILDQYPDAESYATQQIESYTEEQIDELIANNQYQAFYDSLLQQWVDAIQACFTPCSDGSVGAGETPLSISCDILQTQIVEDMIPNGQYGLGIEIDVNSSQTSFVESPLSIYNQNNVLLTTQVSLGLHNSWKNPRHYQFDNYSVGLYTQGHYYDDLGNISYIRVKLVDSELEIYEPVIDPNAINTLIPTEDVEITNEYWIEPQYLTNVIDFLNPNVWKNSWVNSLIVYHPEYDYLEYSNAICAMQSPHPNNSNTYFNSDTFDSYLLSINKYQDAIDLNLLNNNALALYSVDPYFLNTPGAPFETPALYEERKRIMRIALETSFDGSGNPMMAVSFSRYACNSLEVCNTSNYTITNMLNVMNSKTEFEKNEFWNSFKVTYIGLKQRIQSLFINSYAMYNGSYNGCIGLSDAPLSLEAAINSYPVPAGVIQDYLNGSSDVLCNYEEANAYMDKVKRFIPSDMFYNSGADPLDITNDLADQVDYNYYIESGTCPLARDLQLYIDQYFQETNNNPTFSINSDRDYNGLYLSPPLFEDFGGTYPAAGTVGMLGSISGQTFNLQLKSGIVLQDSKVSLVVPSGYTWSSYGDWIILSVSTILGEYNPSSQKFDFTVVAQVKNEDGSLSEILLNGTTKARISDCTIGNNTNTYGEYLGTGNNWDETGACNKETYVSKALTTLLNALIDNNQVNSSNVNITYLPEYSTSYLPEFFGLGSTVVWSHDGSTTYTIEINGVQYFTMTLDNQLPTNVEVTNVGFNYILSNTNAIMGQEIKITWLDSNFSIDFTEGTVAENSTRVLNFLCCADINELPNTGPCDGLSCEDIVLQILNYLKDNNLITNPQTPYDLNNPTVARLTCIDEFFNLTPSDELIWANPASNPNVYSLELNGVVIFQVESISPNLADPSIVSFNSINTNSPAEAITYYTADGILKTLRTSKFVIDCNELVKRVQLLKELPTPQILSMMDECDIEEPCIPQPLTPVTCDEKYNVFRLTINSIDDGDQQIDYEDFCRLQLKYLADSYKFYIDTLVLTDNTVSEYTLSLRYMTIVNFGATVFGYGYNDMNQVILAYKNHVDMATNEDAIMTWAAFTSEHLFQISEGGEVCISLPASVVIPTDDFSVPVPDISPCYEFTQSIYNSYAQEAYSTFLATRREEFIKAYLKNAIENAVENFDMVYYDKEYQYTLYYYDQAGNLIETVPPEGVDRFSETELNAINSGESLTFNDKINAYRNNNTAQENSNFLPDHTYKTYYKYNSLNQLVWQLTPDGGETRFAYDALGRIIASQNAKQLENNTFSYTTYDSLGRIIEAGELVPNVTLFINESTGKLTCTTLSENDIFNNVDYPFPKSVSSIQNEVTRTQYTTPVSYAADIFRTVETFDVSLQEKTRNRVTAIYNYDTVTASTLTRDYTNAIYYNYDIHGNVIEMVNDNKLLVQSLDVPFTGIKNVEYKYDLISGNVNKVYYQRGKTDQFIHQYTYDADNRIVSVETSSDGYIWEKDAAYEYFPHGPLARTTLGDTKVQGLDYAYTLQGWLKGINSNTLNNQDDMGADGSASSDVADDTFGFSLNYFEGDYQSIGTINAFVNNGTANPKNLYNGNIKQMATALLNTNETRLPTQLNNYEYDQLNRIKVMQGYAINGGSSNANYNASYSYDRNGNLKTLTRAADNGATMDDLEYFYKSKLNPVTGLMEPTNQLDHVDDDITAITHNDIGPQPSGNYEYDAIGQLISDQTEGITNIDWRVDGKVKQITKADGKQIKFTYDGLGNRIAKTVLPDDITTLYLRDAQGNVMAVYDTNESDITDISPNKNLILKEHHIYGSSRLGIEEKYSIIPQSGAEPLQVPDNLVLDDDILTGTELFQAVENITVAGLGNTYTISATANVIMEAGNSVVLKPGFNAVSGSDFLARIADIDPGGNSSNVASGDKRYELSNHLGNVLSVITDRKIYDPTDIDGNPFKADVVSFNDYYPFGITMPSRSGSVGSYRYGFQGQEKDDEVKGEGNSINYKFRMHDPRVGRFFAMDPLAGKFPELTPYQFASNSPIALREIEGLEGDWYVLDLRKEEPQLQFNKTVDYGWLPNFLEPDYVTVEVPGPNNSYISYTFTATGSGNKRHNGELGNGNYIGDFQKFKENPLEAIRSGEFVTDAEIMGNLVRDIAISLIFRRVLKSGRIGKSWEGKAYRYETPDRVDGTWDANKYNKAADHRYSKPGEAAVYAGITKETAKAEISHYNALDGRKLVSKDIKLNNALDLTDANVRKELGVTLDDITSDSYDITQKIGTYARQNGYDGIIAPSARDNGGANVIIFGEAKED